MSIMKIESKGVDTLTVSYPPNHPKADKIKKWLEYLSVGYIEYLLQFGEDPHCSACRASDCDNVGMGDDACRGFIFGLKGEK